MSFDKNGNWTPAPTFPAMQGYGSVLTPATPLADSAFSASLFGAPMESAGWAPDFGKMQINTAGFDAIPGMSAATSAATATPGFFDSLKTWGKDSGFLGYRDGDGNRVDGWGGAAFSAANGLMSGFLGMKQYGLFKDQLAQSKRQFDLNYEAQKKTLNSHLEDRQRARVASNAGAYQSVGDYMNKNGI